MNETRERKNEIRFTDHPQMNRLLNHLVAEVQDFSEVQLRLIRRLTQIGSALSAEKNLGKLLEMIIDEARDFTCADGGTLYIMSDDEQELQFAIVQNGTLGVRMGGTGDRITWPAVRLHNPDGTENFSNVSAFVALTGKAVNIPDVYHAEGFNFEGTKKFDERTGYRSMSMLVLPMRNHENDIIGVLQLLNAKDAAAGEVIAFSKESQEMTESLASQAAVALTNNRLIGDLEELLESFIRTIASAIDEKSPYTGGHIRRVAELTMDVAQRINEAGVPPYKDRILSEDELRELRIAAWLHDVGKITTPEHVVDKATKLQTICDRITILQNRIEIIKKDHIIGVLRNRLLAKETGEDLPDGDYEDDFTQELDDDLKFLETTNLGGEFLPDDKLKRLRELSEKCYVIHGKNLPVITEDERENLSIRRGTLTDAEREIINNHTVVTYKMLSQLPFPKKMKHVPEYAAAHHERLDGTGYPLGLKGDQIPLQARILALADVFEALTARDRPYTKGKTLAEALKIVGFMVKDRHIDGDLFDLFVREKLYENYIRRELPHLLAELDGGGAGPS
jgi:HD-GYP domain-containing protein (c-di-GMP phosphodiesterase class II)